MYEPLPDPNAASYGQWLQEAEERYSAMFLARHNGHFSGDTQLVMQCVFGAIMFCGLVHVELPSALAFVGMLTIFIVSVPLRKLVERLFLS